MDPNLTVLLLAYVVFPLMFVLMEKFWFSLPDRKILRSSFGSDVIWYGFQSFVSQRLAPIVVYFVLMPVVFVYGMTTEEFFSGFGPVAQLPFWWQVPVVFVLADFQLYWQHRLFHTQRAWPFHAVHHSSRDLDWLSATENSGTFLNYWKNSAAVPVEREMIPFGRQPVTASVRFAKLYPCLRQTKLRRKSGGSS
jgi:sterol desaturase/sphingolipid hydroxylase (fatty acid hydroxylase superfamily)